MPEEFDFQKAITAAKAIHQTFKQERGIDMYPDQWDAFIYVFIKDALLEPHDFVLTSPARAFLQVYVPTEEEVRFMIKEHDDLKIGANSTSQTLQTSQTPQQDRALGVSPAQSCTHLARGGAGHLCLFVFRQRRMAGTDIPQ